MEYDVAEAYGLLASDQWQQRRDGIQDSHKFDTRRLFEVPVTSPYTIMYAFPLIIARNRPRRDEAIPKAQKSREDLVIVSAKIKTTKISLTTQRLQ